MKIGIKIALMVFVMVVLTASIGDICFSSIRREETFNLASNGAMKVANLLRNKSVSITSEKDMVAELVKTIMTEKHTDSPITIQVLNVDAKNGLVDINVVQEITHLNGKVEYVSERKTIVVE